MKRTYALIFAVSAQLVALPEVAANLVTNPDFSSDLSGWAVTTTNGATAMWEGGAGSPAVGAARLSLLGGGGRAQVEQCINITPQQVDFMFRTLNAGAYFGYQLLSFAGPDCTATSTVVSYFDPNSFYFLPDLWLQFHFTHVLPASTQSVKVLFVADSFGSPSTDTYAVDNVRLGPSGTVPVTLQNFRVD